jgi:peptidyl-prolyl cis-trans isomerase D
MSVIQSIRDKYAAFVIALIALSLIGFILMDAFSNQSRGGLFGNTTTVGKVNGEKLQKDAFEKKINVTQAMYGGQAQRDQLIGMVWNQAVDDIVMQQEYAKAGLSFTAKELNDKLFGNNPPDFMKQQFGDPAKGEPYRVAEAKAYFANLKKQQANPQFEMFYEAYIKQGIIDVTLRQKYMALLSQAAYVPKWMAEKQIADNNALTSFSYVAVPYTTIVDSTIKVSDAEVQAYMKKHPTEFKSDEASRSISYVSFNALPNGNDSSAALNSLLTLQNDFATATDGPAYLGRVGTDLPYSDAFVLGSKLQVPNADSIKRLSIGQTFGPYLDGANYTIAKMVATRTMPDSVKCRHILVKFGSGVDDSTAKKRIDSIKTAVSGGADFNAMVLKYSDDDGSKTKGGEYEFTSTQFSNLSKEFAEVIFYGTTGDKKVVRVSNSSYSGYHYIEVVNQKKIETAYKIAYLAKAISASGETINNANTLAQQFAASVKNKKQFDEAATKQSLQVLTAADIKENDFSAGSLGQNRKFVRWIYDNDLDDVSEPEDMGDKYVVAVITEVSSKGMMSVTKARPNAEPFIRNEKKAQQIISTKIKGATLEAIAQSAGTTVMSADSVSFQNTFIAGVGNEPKVVGAIFNKAQSGKVTDAIAGATGVFVVKPGAISAQANTANVAELQKNMEAQLKSSLSYRSVEGLKKAATIKDNRFEFY